MGLFGGLVDMIDTWRFRRLMSELHPLHGYKLLDFALLDGEPGELLHYFKFRNKDGASEEFIVRYNNGFGQPVYSQTHWRRAGERAFAELSERGPWSPAITSLIEAGAQRAPGAPRRARIDGFPGAASASVARPSVPQLLQKGHRYLDEQKLEEAIAAYTSAIEAETGRAECYFYRGVAFSNRYTNKGKNAGDLDKAIGDYTRAIELDPEYAAAFFQRAGLYKEKGSTARAIADYSESITRKHNLSSSYFCRGLLWEAAGDRAKAMADFGSAIETGKDFTRTAALVARGKAHQKAEKFEKALADFTQALSEAPQAPGILVHRASALRDLGRIQEAVVDLDRAIELAPHAADAWNLRGHCYSRLGQQDRARQNFEHAAALNEGRDPPPSAEPVPQGAPDSRRPNVSVDVSPWEISMGRYNEVGRVYEFTGLAGPGAKTRFDVRCRLTPDGNGAGKTIAPFIYFVIEPHILDQTGHLVAQFGPSDSLLDYEFFAIQVEPIATGANFLLVDAEHTQQCLKALLAGRQLTLRLISNAEQLAHFPLENDEGFAQAYAELHRRVVAGPT